ncbi:hypothetical protein [Flavobacterium psychrotolerans]|uniref:Uncharacterized protein n=1 Tax=Flavobacterium psychrotolerans TaxID=2169410 RepID=A0A2U1JGE0_9FLAO|nr:hypothetical protein [Flavobacterium psychrotolerans]PWA04054.1 hypothetical protein DB895_12755 [Flavobacterium psychrotolerans]
MEFDKEFWRTPEHWIAAIILDSERNQTYGKTKNGYAILERVPKPETGFNYLDIVKVNGPIGNQMYRDDEIEEFLAVEIVKKSELKTYSYEAILPTSRDYFELLEWFVENGQKTEMEFSMNFSEGKWLKGRCSSKSFSEAEKILKSFIKQEKGNLIEKIKRIFSNKYYGRKIRNLK